MTNEAPYTDEQWYAMCDQRIGTPVPLHTADLTIPWVYYRPWGLMHVPFGYHQGAMATLYAFTLGFTRYLAAADALNMPHYRACETMADRFLLELEGTAFMSSASNIIQVGRRDALDSAERMAFRAFQLRYLED